MRLKTLNLQGFKTFAPKTDLVFGEGLSAVVGPNGSGKSNIADSIRWVLGEQSLSHLRAKKTEDLIFAGSSNRAPLGMAEVSITLDNSDRLLPLDFTEVTLTRRAYRSGENEYYINKSRVRLRDITELASTLGQAYTVVGQGLIDAALSLRPEERRELFEEAATIRGYFVQREEALRRLGKTEENIARVNDLAVELEPQVRRLERQARQAQDYGKLEAELHTLLREWFRGRWTLGSHELKRATEAEEAAAAQVEVRKQEVTRISIELAEARAQVRSHLGRTSELHEQRARVQALHAAKSQSLAVLEERLSAGTARSGTLAQEQKQTQQALASLRDQLSGVEEESQQRSNELGALREAGKSVTSKLSELDATLRDLRKRRDSADAEVQAYTNKLRDLTTRLEAASRQLTEQTQFVDQEKQQIVLLEKSLSSRQTAVKQQESDLEAAQSAVKAAEQAHREARAELEAARSGQSAAEAKRRELARQADQLSGQLALVTGEQQAGLYGGVRAVVAAAGRKELDGYLGTVADLISVPAELETAIEAGLGGRLQEVVMATWGHTEKAISMLKQKGAGRATFLPLDTLRAHRNGQAPSGAGILGLARDLVRYEPPLATLAESLMGRLLIVEDLPAARRTIASLQASTPWTLATIEGEVVRPGGSVTGGSNSSAGDARAKGRTILALQRRRRELEQTRDDLAEQVEAAEKELARAISLVQRQEAGLGSKAAAVDTARQHALKAQVAHMEQENAQAGLRREIGWHRDRVGDTEGKIG
ncbi:MAG TPA: AAA family ATPase, partial [Chloroflexia bacterium]|nr:AAA family ATPase [Chloroflexia bacterium]